MILDVSREEMMIVMIVIHTLNSPNPLFFLADSSVDDPNQGARFATLLFYLNDGMKGGETTFPRWVNGESFHKLRVVPKAGKAVLFYSQLPDGNMDDFSQHAAEPIIEGEKWVRLLGNFVYKVVPLCCKALTPFIFS